ncbi:MULTISPECIES: sulfite exporter TauE/SafE family protein [unclassified Roseovarius]|uniref:sulfite exporter TauE/SafE family protein n=1 Tax=unclassified Roseovarius TaxID=2614913 RepID=UPI00273DBFE7|nr:MULTISPECIES: sulfite exporter TauE/SafE family protein [unclassified Roseovarius]
MTTETILFLMLGAAAGGFINGLTGTGTALFALGFYLVVLDPIRAVAIVALMSVLAGLQGLWIVRSEILAQPARLLRFLLPGLIGVPIGLRLLDVIDAGTLRIAIATLLVIYGAYFGFRTALPAFSRRTPWADGMFGFVGGVFGGAAAVSGAIPSMWLSIRPWTKAETRAVLQPYNVTILCTTICLLFFKGAYDRTALSALLVTIPVGLIAAQVGIAVFRSLSDTAYRRLLILLTLLMGIGIMLSEIT